MSRPGFFSYNPKIPLTLSHTEGSCTGTGTGSGTVRGTGGTVILKRMVVVAARAGFLGGVGVPVGLGCTTTTVLVEVEAVGALGTVVTGLGVVFTGVGAGWVTLGVVVEAGVGVGAGEAEDPPPTKYPPPLVTDEESGDPKRVKSEKWLVSQVTVWAAESRVQLERTFHCPWS
jgi:hypothetical protein